MVVESHCQRDGQEEAKECKRVDCILVHPLYGMLIHLAHVLLHSHLHAEGQSLRKVGQGLPQSRLNIGVRAA